MVTQKNGSFTFGAAPSAQQKPQAVAGRNTLLNVAPMRTWLVQFSNQNGTVQPPLTVVEVGGMFYVPKNAVEWTSELRECTPWLIESMRNFVAGYDNAQAGAPSASEISVIDEAAPTEGPHEAAE